MTVKLRRKSQRFRELTPGQRYLVIGIEANDLRVLDDGGRPHLYPKSIFQVVDAGEPPDWITEVGKDGERYAYPRILNSAGFFEDFFDGKRRAVQKFWRAVNERLTATVAG